MKKLVFLLLMLLSASAFAAGPVEFGATYYGWYGKGHTPEYGYSTKISVPTGLQSIDVRQVNQHYADTTVTFSWIVEADIDVYGDFDAKGATSFARKTLGIWGLFADAGLTVWEFEGEDKSTFLDGYHLGLGASARGFTARLSANVFPDNGENTEVLTGFYLGYKF